MSEQPAAKKSCIRRYALLNASTASVSGSYYVKRGYYYRLKATFYVYSNGELKETINDTYDYGYFE